MEVSGFIPVIIKMAYPYYDGSTSSCKPRLLLKFSFYRLSSTVPEPQIFHKCHGTLFLFPPKPGHGSRRRIYHLDSEVFQAFKLDSTRGMTPAHCCQALRLVMLHLFSLSSQHAVRSSVSNDKPTYLSSLYTGPAAAQIASPPKKNETYIIVYCLESLFPPEFWVFHYLGSAEPIVCKHHSIAHEL